MIAVCLTTNEKHIECQPQLLQSIYRLVNTLSICLYFFLMKDFQPLTYYITKYHLFIVIEFQLQSTLFKQAQLCPRCHESFA